MSRKPRRQPGDNSFHWTLQRSLPFTYHSVLRMSRAGSPALHCTEYSVRQPEPAMAYSYNLFHSSSGCSRRWSIDKTGKKLRLMTPVTSFQGVFFSSICSHICNTELCVFLSLPTACFHCPSHMENQFIIVHDGADVLYNPWLSSPIV